MTKPNDKPNSKKSPKKKPVIKTLLGNVNKTSKQKSNEKKIIGKKIKTTTASKKKSTKPSGDTKQKKVKIVSEKKRTYTKKSTCDKKENKKKIDTKERKSDKQENKKKIVSKETKCNKQENKNKIGDSTLPSVAVGNRKRKNDSTPMNKNVSKAKKPKIFSDPKVVDDLIEDVIRRYSFQEKVNKSGSLKSVSFKNTPTKWNPEVDSHEDSSNESQNSLGDDGYNPSERANFAPDLSDDEKPSCQDPPNYSSIRRDLGPMFTSEPVTYPEDIDLALELSDQDQANDSAHESESSEEIIVNEEERSDNSLDDFDQFNKRVSVKWTPADKKVEEKLEEETSEDRILEEEILGDSNTEALSLESEDEDLLIFGTESTQSVVRSPSTSPPSRRQERHHKIADESIFSCESQVCTPSMSPPSQRKKRLDVAEATVVSWESRARTPSMSPPSERKKRLEVAGEAILSCESQVRTPSVSPPSERKKRLDVAAEQAKPSEVTFEPEFSSSSSELSETELQIARIEEDLYLSSSTSEISEAKTTSKKDLIENKSSKTSVEKKEADDLFNPSNYANKKSSPPGGSKQPLKQDFMSQLSLAQNIKRLGRNIHFLPKEDNLPAVSGTPKASSDFNMKKTVKLKTKENPDDIKKKKTEIIFGSSTDASKSSSITKITKTIKENKTSNAVIKQKASNLFESPTENKILSFNTKKEESKKDAKNSSKSNISIPDKSFILAEKKKTVTSEELFIAMNNNEKQIENINVNTNRTISSPAEKKKTVTSEELFIAMNNNEKQIENINVKTNQTISSPAVDKIVTEIADTNKDATQKMANKNEKLKVKVENRSTKLSASSFVSDKNALLKRTNNEKNETITKLKITEKPNVNIDKELQPTVVKSAGRISPITFNDRKDTRELEKNEVKKQTTKPSPASSTPLVTKPTEVSSANRKFDAVKEKKSEQTPVISRSRKKSPIIIKFDKNETSESKSHTNLQLNVREKPKPKLPTLSTDTTPAVNLKAKTVEMQEKNKLKKPSSALFSETEPTNIEYLPRSPVTSPARKQTLIMRNPDENKSEIKTNVVSQQNFEKKEKSKPPKSSADKKTVRNLNSKSFETVIKEPLNETEYTNITYTPTSPVMSPKRKRSPINVYDDQNELKETVVPQLSAAGKHKLKPPKPLAEFRRKNEIFKGTKDKINQSNLSPKLNGSYSNSSEDLGKDSLIEDLDEFINNVENYQSFSSMERNKIGTTQIADVFQSNLTDFEKMVNDTLKSSCKIKDEQETKKCSVALVRVDLDTIETTSLRKTSTAILEKAICNNIKKCPSSCVSSSTSTTLSEPLNISKSNNVPNTTTSSTQQKPKLSKSLLLKTNLMKLKKGLNKNRSKNKPKAMDRNQTLSSIDMSMLKIEVTGDKKIIKTSESVSTVNIESREHLRNINAKERENSLKEDNFVKPKLTNIQTLPKTNDKTHAAINSFAITKLVERPNTLATTREKPVVTTTHIVRTLPKTNDKTHAAINSISNTKLVERPNTLATAREKPAVTTRNIVRTSPKTTDKTHAAVNSIAITKPVERPGTLAMTREKPAVTTRNIVRTSPKTTDKTHAAVNSIAITKPVERPGTLAMTREKPAVTTTNTVRTLPKITKKTQSAENVTAFAKPVERSDTFAVPSVVTKQPTKTVQIQRAESEPTRNLVESEPVEDDSFSLFSININPSIKAEIDKSIRPDKFTYRDEEDEDEEDDEVFIQPSRDRTEEEKEKRSSPIQILSGRTGREEAVQNWLNKQPSLSINRNRDLTSQEICIPDYCTDFLRTSTGLTVQHNCTGNHRIPCSSALEKILDEDDSPIDKIISSNFTNPPVYFVKRLLELCLKKSHRHPLIVKLGTALTNIEDKTISWRLWKEFVFVWYQTKTVNPRTLNQSMNDILDLIFQGFEHDKYPRLQAIQIILECITEKSVESPSKVKLLMSVEFLSKTNFPNKSYPDIFKMACFNQVISALDPDLKRKFAYKAFKTLIEPVDDVEKKRLYDTNPIVFEDFLKCLDIKMAADIYYKVKEPSSIPPSHPLYRDIHNPDKSPILDVGILIRKTKLNAVYASNWLREFNLNNLPLMKIFEAYEGFSDGRVFYQRLVNKADDQLKEALAPVTFKFLTLEAVKKNWDSCFDLYKSFYSFDPSKIQDLGGCESPARKALLVIQICLQKQEIREAIDLFIKFKFTNDPQLWVLSWFQDDRELWAFLCRDIQKILNNFRQPTTVLYSYLLDLVIDQRSFETPIDLQDGVDILICNLVKEGTVISLDLARRFTNKVYQERLLENSFYPSDAYVCRKLIIDIVANDPTDASFVPILEHGSLTLENYDGSLMFESENLTLYTNLEPEEMKAMLAYKLFKMQDKLGRSAFFILFEVSENRNWARKLPCKDFSLSGAKNRFWKVVSEHFSEIRKGFLNKDEKSIMLDPVILQGERGLPL